MRVDFLGLQAFLAIAERGSFRHAATHLGITQTALSHRIKKFEEQVQVTLLTRTTRQVALTPAGLSLLPKARQLIEQAQLLFDELSFQAAARQETLAIGCLASAAIHFLPGVLAEFHQFYPAMAIRIHDNSANEIAERVQKGEAEFGITILGTNRWDLEMTPLVKEPFVLICREDHEFARQRSLRWSQLEGVPLVRVSARTGNRMLIDDALGGRSETMNWAYEVQHVASAVSLVAAGVGCTVLPRLAINIAAEPALVAVSLRDPSITRTLGAVTRRGVPLTAPARKLLKLIEIRLQKRQ